MTSANLLQCFEKTFMRRAGFIEQSPRVGAFDVGESKEHVLGRDELVSKILCLFLGPIENLIELAGDIRLRIALPGIACSFFLALVTQRCDADPELLENGCLLYTSPS